MRRIALIKNHLSQDKDTKSTLEHYRKQSSIDSKSFKLAYYDEHYHIRESIYDYMKGKTLFNQSSILELNRRDSRELAWKQMKAVTLDLDFTYEKFQNDKNLREFYLAIGAFDMNLSTKWSVSTCLYGLTIKNMGTERHQKYARDVMNFKDIGCFALTELSHGSNAKSIQTKAEYAHSSKRIIINTPSEHDVKFWIGAAAHLANIAVVWANLYVEGKNHGIHPIIVPLRDKKTHDLFEGITIGDCGSKAGLNGVDNGFLFFKNVSVPVENLLDRFSKINQDGKFESPYDSIEKRLAVMFGTLTTGRVYLVDLTNTQLLSALTVASRFACTRRQFGIPGQLEYPIIEYPKVQLRIFSYLATSFGISVANKTVQELLISTSGKLADSKNPALAELHAVSSALKAYASWQSQRGIQECRELCGGLGYSKYNRIGTYREDNDINATWEGDGNILIQQTIKFLLEAYGSARKGKKGNIESLKFLFENPTPKFDLELKDENLLKIFEARLVYLLSRITEAFITENKTADNPFEAWNNIQILFASDAANAYCEYFVFERFLTKISSITHEKTKAVVQNLLSLYAYNILDQDNSVREMGLVKPKEAMLIKQNIKAILSKLKPELAGIIDSISIPDHILNSAIGASNGDIYNNFLKKVKEADGCFEKPGYWKDIF